MSMLRMMESRLPPGFRFHPRDEELVCDYLAKRAASTAADVIMEVINLNNCEPWELPETACLGGKEWYFFSLRDRKYATGQRMNRATKSGFWKATGKDRPVVRQGSLVGMRKTLVFYQGRAPKGTKTHWVMHEFRTEGLHRSSNFPLKDDWVLCRVFCKSREDATKANMPPLMDSYVGLNQASMALEGCKQVTCSSNPTPSYATPCTDPLERTLPLPTRSLTSGGLSYCWGTLPSDENLIEVPSEQQTTPCAAAGPSLVEDGYSSDADLHCMWNWF